MILIQKPCLFPPPYPPGSIRHAASCGVMGLGDRPGYKYDELYSVIYAQMRVQYDTMMALKTKINNRDVSFLFV